MTEHKLYPFCGSPLGIEIDYWYGWARCGCSSGNPFLENGGQGWEISYERLQFFLFNDAEVVE